MEVGSGVGQVLKFKLFIYFILSGYTLFIQGTSTICAPCTTSCRTCAQGQPGSCLTCGTGFYLSGTNCIQCTTNCNQCTAAGCLSCVSGYFLNSGLSCSLNCIVPCSTCSSNNPAKCMDCIAGYNYNSLTNTCSPILACNGACSICPLGYSLNLGKCIQCTGANCQTCNANSPGVCTSCVLGFYLNSNNQCVTCMKSCSSCLTGTGCMTCATGFTTIQNIPLSPSGYQCVACNSPCATCINTPNYCTSCVAGYQFTGWKCTQSFYFSFTITLLTNLTTFNQNYFNFIQALTNAIAASNTNTITITSITDPSNTKTIKITSITPGSVMISGGAGPTGNSGSKQASQQFSSLDASLAQNGQIAGMTVGDAAVTVIGGSVDYSQVNLALILGICIPVGILLIAGIILYIYCKKKRSAQVIQQKIKQDSGYTVRQSFQLSANYKDENTSRPFQESTAIN